MIFFSLVVNTVNANSFRIISYSSCHFCLSSQLRSKSFSTGQEHLISVVTYTDEEKVIYSLVYH